MLLAQPVDKPPVLFYAQALFYPLFGPVEWAARLPNLIASLLLVPIVGVLAWRIFADEKAPIISSALIALTPLTVQFSATAFTDPLLTFFLIGSILLALIGINAGSEGLNQAPYFSGAMFSLAVATKFQAGLFLPLIVGLIQLTGRGWRFWRQWLIGLLPISLLMAVWMLARSIDGNIVSLQLANFGGLRPIWSWELVPRLRDWFYMWGTAWGSPWVGGLMAMLLLAAVFQIWREQNNQDRISVFLLVFCSGYLSLHWLTAVPVWDRYLLPIWPLLAMLIGVQISKVAKRMLLGELIFYALLIVVMLPAAWQARNGRYFIGGQPEADQGAALVAQILARQPYGTVLYDHWYSWHWRYQFFDGQIYPSWFQSPESLAQELNVFGRDGNRHYLALPDTAVAKPVIRAVNGAGFELQPVSVDGDVHILLYEIIPKPHR